MASIVHVTTVHDRFDVRIFLKECRSLQQRGHDVSLVVADGSADQVRDGVKFISIPLIKGRLARMAVATFRALRRVWTIHPDICHLHDPELIPAGLFLKAGGIKVIYDSHEDLPKQILGKPYLPRIVRCPLAGVASIFLRLTLPRMDGLVAATPSIQSALAKLNANTVTINNYPILGEFEDISQPHAPDRSICYVGGATRIRGIIELVLAMDLLPEDVRLMLAGPFEDAALFRTVSALPGWRKVDYLGVVGRDKVAAIMAASVCGIVTYLDTPNHVEAQPNKMFEYMSAGLPVIGSHFPLWRSVLEQTRCGICVDPADPCAIADGVKELLDNPEAALGMGRNGRRAVQAKFNWAVEADRLAGFYGRMLEGA